MYLYAQKDGAYKIGMAICGNEIVEASTDSECIFPTFKTKAGRTAAMETSESGQILETWRKQHGLVFPEIKFSFA